MLLHSFLKTILTEIGKCFRLVFPFLPGLFTLPSGWVSHCLFFVYLPTCLFQTLSLSLPTTHTYARAHRVYMFLNKIYIIVFLKNQTFCKNYIMFKTVRIVGLGQYNKVSNADNRRSQWLLTLLHNNHNCIKVIFLYILSVWTIGNKQ